MFNTLLEEETRRNEKERVRCAEAVEQGKFLWKEAEKRGKTSGRSRFSGLREASTQRTLRSRRNA
jgi:hypothetical protein